MITLPLAIKAHVRSSAACLRLGEVLPCTTLSVMSCSGGGLLRVVSAIYHRVRDARHHFEQHGDHVALAATDAVGAQCGEAQAGGRCVGVVHGPDYVTAVAVRA